MSASANLTRFSGNLFQTGISHSPSNVVELTFKGKKSNVTFSEVESCKADSILLSDSEKSSLHSPVGSCPDSSLDCPDNSEPKSQNSSSTNVNLSKPSCVSTCSGQVSSTIPAQQPLQASDVHHKSILKHSDQSSVSSSGNNSNKFHSDDAQIGKYQFVKTIGKGNFAKVKLARHVITGKEVAIKIIDKKTLNHQSLTKLFREVRIMKVLDHPNIVRLFEVIDNERILYLVMEYASGGELFDYLVSHGRMKEKEARAKFRQIISALQYCHSKFIVHRDLKAENLLLDSELNIKLADFGFANEFKHNQKLNTFCGSPPYAAPELFQGKRYDGPEVDVWSLGVILYTLVSGSLPFDGQNLRDLREKVLRGKYRVPYYMSTDCENMLRKMLVVNPARRASLVVLLNEKWLNIGYENDHLKPYVDDGHEQEIDPIRVNILLEMGFTQDAIDLSLKNHRYDNITATYLLLGHKSLPLVEQINKAVSDSIANSDLKSPHKEKSLQSSQPAADFTADERALAKALLTQVPNADAPGLEPVILAWLRSHHSTESNSNSPDDSSLKQKSNFETLQNLNATTDVGQEMPKLVIGANPQNSRRRFLVQPADASGQSSFIDAADQLKVATHKAYDTKVSAATFSGFNQSAHINIANMARMLDRQKNLTQATVSGAYNSQFVGRHSTKYDQSKATCQFPGVPPKQHLLYTGISNQNSITSTQGRINLNKTSQNYANLQNQISPYGIVNSSNYSTAGGRTMPINRMHAKSSQGRNSQPQQAAYSEFTKNTEPKHCHNHSDQSPNFAHSPRMSNSSSITSSMGRAILKTFSSFRTKTGSCSSSLPSRPFHPPTIVEPVAADRSEEDEGTQFELCEDINKLNRTASSELLPTSNIQQISPSSSLKFLHTNRNIDEAGDAASVNTIITTNTTKSDISLQDILEKKAARVSPKTGRKCRDIVELTLNAKCKPRRLLFAFSIESTTNLKPHLMMDKIVEVLSCNSVQFRLREPFLLTCKWQHCETASMLLNKTDKRASLQPSLSTNFGTNDSKSSATIVACRQPPPPPHSKTTLVEFELEICRLLRGSHNGVRFKRLIGDSISYTFICSKISRELNFIAK